MRTNIMLSFRCSLIGWLITASACTEKNPAYCESDAECTNSARPFCDVGGEYPESDYTAHACSPMPSNCPVERCGCVAGTPLSCIGDQVTLCGSDGHSKVIDACPLGCSTTEPRCLRFAPSNDLEDALMDASAEPDVVFPPVTRIDTTLGLVQDGNGATVSVQSVLIAQNGGTSMIRAFKARSFVMDDVTVTGEHALAFVAPESISIRGRIDASAKKVVGGPGSQERPAVCVGADTKIENSGCTTNCYGWGAGGGGNGTAGGAGGGNGAFGSPAGVLVPSFVPLVGGCRGGRLLDGTTVLRTGGAGGGALQFVSLRSIRFTNVGVISVGGGGGPSTTGGGSGGTIVLEAPLVEFEGTGTGLFANGGGGGGCGSDGADANLSYGVAVGPNCTPYSAGDGGTAVYPVTSGEICTGTCQLKLFGGGGGAAGKARIATKDSTFKTVEDPLISAVVTASTLIAK
jgi:hypothetical protein